MLASWGRPVPASTVALVFAGLVASTWGFASGAARTRAALHAASGTATAALFLVDLGAWIRVMAALVAAHAIIAALPEWRGIGRSGRQGAWDAASGPGVALLVPLTIGFLALTGGQAAILADTFAVAMPRELLARLALDLALVLVTLLACDGPRARSGPARVLGVALSVMAVAMAALRLAWLVSMATLPTEISWSEAPALVAALKLDAHLPLYGPPEQLDSYTYSPLVDLLHHALLAPLGMQLSIHAHRALAALEQMAALALLLWAMGPRLARAGWRWAVLSAVLGVATFSSLLAPAVHPDHLVLVAFAVAVALLVAETRWSRGLWWAALLLVTPLATAAKVPGAGIGVALGLVFALERRWRPALVALGSLALAVATVPLFDATLGRFSFYAIHVQSTHPVVWLKLMELPSKPAGVVALGVALALVAMARAHPRAPMDRDVLRVATLTAVCAAAGLPGWLKYAGRDNNLVLLALGALCAGMLGSVRRAEQGGPNYNPLLPSAASLLAVIALVAPSLPFAGAARSTAFAEAALVTRTVQDDTLAGRKTLAPLHMAAWISAGRRDVPGERFQSAVELWYGGFPQAQLLFDRIEDGRYDTVVVTGAYLQADQGPLGRFDARLREAIERRYELAEPTRAFSVDSHPGALVFRRAN
jgi:hypothetical protein